MTTCPQCGCELTPVTLGGDHAPFMCAGCSLAFWPAELTDDARLHWRASHHDFGHGEHVRHIARAREQEWTSQRKA